MKITTICGILAMILVQGSTVFQLIKFVKSKRTEGVSIGFWWTIAAGLALYLIYAISIGDWLYITSNSVGLVLCLSSVILYYHYRKNEPAQPMGRCQCEDCLDLYNPWLGVGKEKEDGNKNSNSSA